MLFQVTLMPQVQLRLPEKMIAAIDVWVSEGKFQSRSDAIRTIISSYEVREKTRKFFDLLQKHSQEAKHKPDKLVSLEEA
jgi:Arc/MetJ-type ribon-helix-helix transcriptional regulator